MRKANGAARARRAMEKRSLKKDILYTVVRIIDGVIDQIVFWAGIMVVGGLAGVGFGLGLAWFGTWL